MKTKKFVSMLLVLTTLINLNARFYAHALTANSLKSAYINKDSWLIKELEERLNERHNPSKDEYWKEKVLVGYECIDERYPASEDMVDILKKDDVVALSIPMGYDDFLEDDAELAASIKFEKPVADIVGVLNSPEHPIADVKYTIDFYNLGDNVDDYVKEIDKLGKAITNALAKHDDVVQDFDFESDVKIYVANIEHYTYGFILVDKDDKKLFWCRKAVREFEKSKLYKLKDVLDAHATFARNLAEMLSGHRGWF